MRYFTLLDLIRFKILYIFILFCECRDKSVIQRKAVAVKKFTVSFIVLNLIRLKILYL